MKTTYYLDDDFIGLKNLRLLWSRMFIANWRIYKHATPDGVVQKD